MSLPGRDINHGSVMENRDKGGNRKRAKWSMQKKEKEEVEGEGL